MNEVLKVAYFSGGAQFTLDFFFELLNSRHELKIVCTKKANSAGRGKKITNTILYHEALKNNIEVITLNNFRDKNIVKTLELLELDFIVVFSFGVILPKEILDIPKYGCVNIHTSLLPRWRGSSPIQHALLTNEKETGFTLIIMNEKLDEGDIIYKKKVIIDIKDNYYTLLNKINKLVCKKLIRVLEDLSKGNAHLLKQDNSKATYCYKIKKQDTYIRFNKSAQEIFGQIRALCPSPGAKFYLQGELIKVHEAKVENSSKFNKNYGVIVDNNLLISCKRGFIRLLKIQREGRKVMQAKEVLNGWKLKTGLIINAEE